MTPHPDPTPGPHDAPDGEALDAGLLALRERLRQARAERGACPPWEELRDDLLPGGGARTGRAERLAHLELCPYCDAHVREWGKSLDKASDTLGAIEKGVARGVVSGARQLVNLSRGTAASPSAGRATPAAGDTPAPPAPRAPGVADTPRAPSTPATVRPAPPRPVPRPERPVPSAPSPPPAAPPPVPGRLLVVETVEESRLPASVYLCAEALDADVACVERVEELGGDPDLDAVCGVIFAGGRPAEEWPEAVRRARDLAPGRPIVVLASPGVEASRGARRVLGAQLVSYDAAPERLLLALDARLR